MYVYEASTELVAALLPLIAVSVIVVVVVMVGLAAGGAWEVEASML